MKSRNYASVALAVFALVVTVKPTDVMAQISSCSCLVVECPVDFEVPCGSNWSFVTPTVLTNYCCTNVTITINSIVTNDTCPQSITCMWSVQDVCSGIPTNTTNFCSFINCSQTVTLTNPAPLVLTCPSNKTVNCDSAWGFDTPTLTGGCGGVGVTVSVLSEVITGVCPQVFTLTWLATNPCGDSNTCSQTVTVQNTTPPVFTRPNLVANPDFDTYTQCPGDASELGLAYPWFQPTDGTPDFYNACASPASGVSVPANMFGYQEPLNGGQGYGGGEQYSFDGNAVDSSREYLETPLSAPLVAGQTYEVSFWVSLSEGNGYAIGDLGAYLSVGSESRSGEGSLSVTPQVRNSPTRYIASVGNWTLIQGTYTAAGGEDHLTIGNFDDDQDTPSVVVGSVGNFGSYYYVDDVAVSESACPTNKTVHCGDDWSFDTPTAVSACGGTNVTVTVLSTVTTGTCTQLVTRTWLAIDACGNSNTCSQTVTELEAPVILCPSNIVVLSCTNIGVEYSATVTGTCCTNVTVVYTPPSGTVFAPGTLTNVHCVATDCCSNSTSCDFTVSVVEARFDAVPIFGGSPLTVLFTPQSPCPVNISNWFWYFGDGGTISLATGTLVSHIYSNAGTFTPILMTTGTGGILSTNILSTPIVVVSSFTEWQINYFNCTNCLVAAPDADPFGKGISNTNQFLLGLDPTNPASVFKIISMARSTNNVVITWKTAGVRTNAVQATAGGVNGSYNTNGFVDIGSPIVIGATGDATAVYTDTGAATNKPARYYRVLAQCRSWNISLL